MSDNPLFPISYGSSRVTLRQQMAHPTVARLNSEVRRRFIGLQLFLLDTYGVYIGVGTGWRVQPANLPNHASPGNSNHEGFPVSAQLNAIAIDTVGLPTHEAAWSAMERDNNLYRFGLISFTTPAKYPNYTGVLYKGSWDRPHIQPYEVPYSRNYRKVPWQLDPWPIPAKYDVNFIDIDDPLNGPYAGVPPQGPDVPQVPSSDVSGMAAFAAARLDEVPPGMPNHSLAEGSEGNEVYLLQVVCGQFNVGTGGKVLHPGNADGKYGPKTAASVESLQREMLQPDAGKPDGKYGPQTHLALQVLSNNLYTLTHPPAPATPPTPPPPPDPAASPYEAYAAERLAEQPPSMPEHTQEEGSDNQDTYLLQVVINRFHDSNGNVPSCGNPDGKFGPKTKAGLIGLQTEYLEAWGAGNPDGVYGPRSHLALQQLSNALAGVG